MKVLYGLSALVLLTILSLTFVAKLKDTPEDRFKLAKQYLNVIHHGEILRGMYSIQTNKFEYVCGTQACRTDLKVAFDCAIPVEIARYEDNYARFLATHLSEADLHAAISFAKSRAGLAITRVIQLKSAEIADMNEAFSLATYNYALSMFCLKHQNVCNNNKLTKFARQDQQ